MPEYPLGTFPLGQPVTAVLKFNVLTDPSDPTSAKVPMNPGSFNVFYDCPSGGLEEVTVPSTDPTVTFVRTGVYTVALSPPVAGGYRLWGEGTSPCASADVTEFKVVPLPS